MYYKYHDINMYYEKHGNSKKCILILPGWGNTRKTFTEIINQLKSKYTVYIIDYPGFGNSSILKNDFTIYKYAKLVSSFIKEKKITNLTIISHSFGGRITSILLGKYKLNVNKLILIDVAGIKRINIKIIIKKYIYKLLKLLTYLLPLEKKYKVRRYLYLKYSSKDCLSLPNNMYNTFKNIIKENLYKYYKKIKIPTLIIWGNKDKDTPLKDAKTLNKIINNSKLIVLSNTAHFSYIEKSKEIINYIILFIEKED